MCEGGQGMSKKVLDTRASFYFIAKIEAKKYASEVRFSGYYIIGKTWTLNEKVESIKNIY